MIRTFIMAMDANRKFLPFLIVLFVGSGCAALIYEIVWFQMLQLIIGSSAISLGILLGTFMGGMCVGSVMLSRIISTRYHPLKVYALLELGIGVAGLILLFVLPLIGTIYIGLATHGLWGHFLRGIVCAICLFFPTVLMGATLPAIARWTESTPRGVSWLGFFYGGNIAGAVCGCLFAGFYLLRLYDVVTATYVAVALNLAVALIGYGLAKWADYDTSMEKDNHAQFMDFRGSIGLCGYCNFRRVRAGCSGNLDAVAVANDGGDCLRFFDYSRGFSDRVGGGE